MLTTLARLPQLRSPAACAPLLAELLEAYSQYRNFVVVDANGNITCSAVPMSGPVNVSDRTYFKRAVERRHFAVGDYLIGRITLVPAIAFALPLLGADGRVESIVVATQGLSWLNAEASQLDLPPGATLALTDPSGIVLAHVPPEADLVGKPIREMEVLAAFATAPEGGVLEADRCARRAAAVGSCADDRRRQRGCDRFAGAREHEDDLTIVVDEAGGVTDFKWRRRNARAIAHRHRRNAACR